MGVNLQRAACVCHFPGMLGRIRLGLDVDIHARLEHWRAHLFDQLQHILKAVDDIGTMILHGENNAVVLSDSAKLAHRRKYEPAAITFPETVLVVAVCIVVGRKTVMQRNTPPRSEDLA